MNIRITISERKKNCGCGKDPCVTYGTQKESKEEKDFKSHKMYDPNSDDVMDAKSKEDHEKYAKKGYIHIDPEAIRDILRDEGGAAGIDPFLDSDDIDADEDEIRDALEAMEDVGEHEDGDYILADDKEIIVKIVKEEILKLFLEKKRRKKRRKKKKKSKKKKLDRCARIAKRKYKVWPSAYASGAAVKCRQGKIWKNEK